MNLIIAGSRTLKNVEGIIDNAISLLDIGEVNQVVSGTANGVDKAGENWAETLQQQDYPVQNFTPEVIRFPADWDKHGKAAGHIRNKQMADYADALLLIWDGESRGSANMKETMLKQKKPVYEVILKRHNV